jgi:hypothetical protein
VILLYWVARSTADPSVACNATLAGLPLNFDEPGQERL